MFVNMMVNDDVIRWRCGQLLTRNFMVYNMKPSVGASDFGLRRFWLDFCLHWVKNSL